MHVASLHIYPVKGVRALDLEELEIEPWGPRGDRRWMVVDANGRFVTQREAPTLATVTVHLTEAGLAFTAPEQEAVGVAMPDEGAPRALITIFKARVEAAVASGPVGDWLTRLVGEPCRLVYMDAPDAARPDPAGGTVSFADEHPVLLTSTASLAAFNRAANLDTPMSRFRPNLVVDGAEAWQEDGWRRIAIGEATFEVIGGCGRCVVTTIDQQTGEKAENAEPLRSLSALRRRGPGAPLFGVHLRPLQLGRVRVGDAVSVI